MTRDDLIILFEKAIADAPGVARKGKANPYTSANGHMFSQINKDDQLGIRLPKPRQKALLDEYGAGPFKSYGATMRDYVCLTDEMLNTPGLVTALLAEGLAFVSAMPPGGKKK
nr:hypothetical protein [Hyphomonas sp. Mor2]